VRELRPTYPGFRIAGAAFLADGRLALVEALSSAEDARL
jgi:hypothetical protein